MSADSERHAAFAAEFTTLVEGTTDWAAPSPVPEWRASDVVEHLLGWLPHVVRGWTGVELGDNNPEDPLGTRWRRRAADVQDLLENPERAGMPVESGPFAGDTLAPVVSRLYTPDVYMHSWDLARATGQPVRLDPEFAREVLAGMRQMEDVIRTSGQFGVAQPTTSSDPVDQLMAFVGRVP